MTRELVHAVRSLRRAPGFTAVAVLVLALGMGGAAALFTVVHAVLLRPLPYPEPDRLLQIWTVAPARDLERGDFSIQRYRTVASQAHTFSALGAWTPDSATLMGGDQPVSLHVARADSGVFRALGVVPARGRAFLPEEDTPAGAPVVLLADRLWRRLGSHPDVAGTALTIDGRPSTVVGVMPPGFAFPAADVDLWMPRIDTPSALNEGNLQRGSTYLWLVGRLGPGQTLEAAQADLARLAAAEPRAEFLDAGLQYRAGDLREQMTLDVRPTLLVLLGAVSLVLLIACVNVTALVSARTLDRRRDLAIRLALGAGRGHILRQLLAEGLVVAGAGALLGLGLAWLALRMAIVAIGDRLPRASEVGLDPVVLAAAAAVTLLTGLAFALAAPLGGRDLDRTLRAGSRGVAGARAARAHGVLVALEVALSVVLLAGALLLGRSFLRLRQVDPGFQPAGVLVADVTLPPARFTTPALLRERHQALLAALAELPGVRSAGAAENVPLSGADPQTLVAAEGGPLPPLSERPVVSFGTVTPGWFRTIGVPVRAGRDFTDADTAGVPFHLIVDEAFARRFFPGQDAVGRRIFIGRAQTPLEIVGVVGTIRHASLDSTPNGCFYLCSWQRPTASLSIALRSEGPPTALAPAVRARVQAIDRDLPVARFHTLDEVLGESLDQRRLTLELFAVFAGLALVLSATGLFGLLAWTVGRRTREIGVRRALGAGAREIRALVLGQAARTVGAGLLAGVAVAAFLSRLLAGMLYGVSAADPVSLVLIALLLLAVALGAGVVPVQRALRVDPVVALRED